MHNKHGLAPSVSRLTTPSQPALLSLSGDPTAVTVPGLFFFKLCRDVGRDGVTENCVCLCVCLFQQEKEKRTSDVASGDSTSRRVFFLSLSLFLSPCWSVRGKLFQDFPSLDKGRGRTERNHHKVKSEEEPGRPLEEAVNSLTALGWSSHTPCITTLFSSFI